MTFKTAIDLTGQQFERLTVIGRAPRHGQNRRARWRVRCACGTVKDVSGQQLREGQSRSCGCLQREEMSKRSKGRRRCAEAPE